MLLVSLADPSGPVRELAIRLSETLKMDGRAPAPVWEKLNQMVSDADPRVRLQLAFSLGEFSNEGVVHALASLVMKEGEPRITAAALSGEPALMIKLFSDLTSEAAFGTTSAGSDILPTLAAGIGARHEANEVQKVLAFGTEHAGHASLLAALGDGLARSGFSLAERDSSGALTSYFAGARKVLLAHAAVDKERIDAAQLLGFDRSKDSEAALLAALDPQASPLVTRAVFDALGRFPAAAIGEAVVAQWSDFNVALKSEAARFLTAHPGRAKALLKSLERGKIRADEIPPAQAAQLRQLRDPNLAQSASLLLPAPVAESREAVIKRLLPAIQLAGSVEKGRTLFTQRCATCHRFGGSGNAFGPDLESVVTGGKEKLITHILDPNREVAPQFAAYSAELSDGTALAGVLAGETVDSVVIREPLGRETVVPRSRLTRLQTTGSSPMPEGLEAGLGPQDLADLLDFLTNEKPR